MRVLVTTSTLPRWDRDATPSFVLDQVVAMTRSVPDLDFEILAPHHAGAAYTETMQGIAVHRFRYFWPAGWQRLAYPILPNLRRNPWLVLQVPFLLAAEFVAVLRHCLRRRPDILYSHWFAPQALATGFAALLLGIPHVFTSHSSDVMIMRRIPVIGPALVRFLVRRMVACTVVSRRTLENLRSFFPRQRDWHAVAGKVRILPMGVPIRDLAPHGPEQRAAARARLDIGHRTVILFIGRLTEKKGLPDLIDAFSRLGRGRPELLLVIAGDGEMRESIERQVQHLGIEPFVRLPGFVTGEQKLDFLASADLMVVPSTITADGDAEGLPVALLEGLAAGAVCIATDVSGADDILTDGVDGFLVHERDPAGLAATMQQVIDMESAARAEVAARGRQRAAAFDWVVVARSHDQHLFAGTRAALP